MTDTQIRYQQLIIERKMNLLELAGELQNISKACRIMRRSRQHYYEIKERLQSQGEKGLEHQSRAPQRHPLQIHSSLESLFLEYILQYPAYGYNRLRHLIFMERGERITERQARGVFQRNHLQRFQDRLKYLEQQYETRGFELSPEQLELLSRRSEKVEYQHVHAPHSGYLLCQDTFLVGYMKGVGRVYMQSVVDCSNSYGFARLYTSKDALTTAHMLQDQVLPFYHRWQIPIHAMLTDNGSEYCGLEDHPYELMLGLFDIEHRRTRVKSPQTNGFVERFHRTVLEEFFTQAFRRKFYVSLEDLQRDLDQYLMRYNYQRPHQGYRLNGKTPWIGFMIYSRPRALQYFN